MKTNLTANEVLILINKQWATTNDIKLIGRVGTAAAYRVKREIITLLEEKKVFVPSGVVPMDEVIKYFNININYLKK